MTKIALILGATGRFGQHAVQAFKTAGWKVRCFVRGQDLVAAARGADVIVNAWNPTYADWARDLPNLTAQVIAAAQASGATVIIPGNVYVFGAAGTWDENTPHGATNPLGRLRIEMEQSYRRSGVQTIVLRSGDYLDTRASGNWFDMILTKKVAKGVFVYPGDPDAPHAWGYLPDLARAAVELAEIRMQLEQFEDVPFPGITMTGVEMAGAIERVTGIPQRTQQMRWSLIRILSLFWPMGRGLLEMSYLWSLSHKLGSKKIKRLLPDFQHTPSDLIIKSAVAPQFPAFKTDGESRQHWLQTQIDPNKPMA